MKGIARTAVSVFQEGNAERNEDKACYGEVGRHTALYAM